MIMGAFMDLNSSDIPSTSTRTGVFSSPVVTGIRNFLFSVCGAYGISVTLFFLLRWLFGEQINLIALMNNGIHLLLLPSVILFPLALLQRSRVLMITLIFPFGMALAHNAPLFINDNVTAADGSTVHVMTYNLLARQSRLAPAIDLIREADADIVALQELGHAAADAIESELTDLYPYQALHPHRFATMGQGIISKYPVTETEFWQNTDLITYLGHQRAVIDFDGTPIVIYNNHPVHPLMAELNVSIRWDDMGPVLDRAVTDSATHPTLMMGDFNMTDFTADYGRITASFDDSYYEVGQGLGYTFPNTQAYGGSGMVPLLARLDYVFHDDRWQALSAHVMDRSGGSDHHPLVVELVLLDS